ncbi:MAG: dethiobiotin synthase [Alphaproteobacteria bacterium]
MKGYFVTGTDTNAGKTVVSAYLMQALDGDYWKPVQSGFDGETDTEAVRRLTGLPSERFHRSAYELRAPLSPHESARRDGISISLDAFKLPRTPRPLIVEGAGGVLVPLNGDALMIDLIKRLALPVILVARSTLGTINHTLLSLEALRTRRVEIAGVIMNGAPNEANRIAIETYGRVHVLAEMPILAPLNTETIGAFARAHPLQHTAIA